MDRTWAHGHDCASEPASLSPLLSLPPPPPPCLVRASHFLPPSPDCRGDLSRAPSVKVSAVEAPPHGLHREMGQSKWELRLLRDPNYRMDQVTPKQEVRGGTREGDQRGEGSALEGDQQRGRGSAREGDQRQCL